METTAGDMMDIEPGASVYGSDGEKLGAIMEVGPDYVVVEKGLFFPTDYFVPNGAIASIEPDRITLSLTRDEALQQGWEKDPTGHTDETVPGDTGKLGGPVRDDRQPVTGFAVETDASGTGNAAPAGMASQLGTIPPAADFATLGVAPVDVNSAYTEGESGHPKRVDTGLHGEASSDADPDRQPGDDTSREPSRH